MRLFVGKIPIIAEEIVRSLKAEGDIETSEPGELRLDIEAVMKEYLRAEREIADAARRRLEAQNLPYSHFARAKKSIADERRIGVGEDIIDHLLEQLLALFMHSAHVEEVFAEDSTMRAHMVPILRKHMAVEEELDREVRGRIKNLEEGTRDFEIEYSKTMEEIRRKRGLS